MATNAITDHLKPVAETLVVTVLQRAVGDQHERQKAATRAHAVRLHGGPHHVALLRVMILRGGRTLVAAAPVAIARVMGNRARTANPEQARGLVSLTLAAHAMVVLVLVVLVLVVLVLVVLVLVVLVLVVLVPVGRVLVGQRVERLGRPAHGAVRAVVVTDGVGVTTSEQDEVARTPRTEAALVVTLNAGPPVVVTLCAGMTDAMNATTVRVAGTGLASDPQ